MVQKIKKPIRNLSQKIEIAILLIVMSVAIFFALPYAIPESIRADHFLRRLALATFGFDALIFTLLYLALIAIPRQKLRTRAECQHRIISYCTICKKEF